MKGSNKIWTGEAQGSIVLGEIASRRIKWSINPNWECFASKDTRKVNHRVRIKPDASIHTSILM